MQALGIDLKWLIFQLINFGVLFVGLYYLLNKPMIKMLDQRRADTKDTRELAVKMRAENEVAAARQQEMLDKAQKEAAELLHKATQRGKELEEKLSEEASAKAEKILEKSRAEIAKEKEEMLRDLKAELAKAVIMASEKVLDSTVSDSEKKNQIGKFLKEVA